MGAARTTWSTQPHQEASCQQAKAKAMQVEVKHGHMVLNGEMIDESPPCAAYIQDLNL